MTLPKWKGFLIFSKGAGAMLIRVKPYQATSCIVWLCITPQRVYLLVC